MDTKRRVLVFLILLCSFSVYTQETQPIAIKSVTLEERFPVFSDCQNLQFSDLENCFYNQLQDFIFTNFEIPLSLKQSDYKAQLKVLFEVDATGIFKVIYIDAIEEKLIIETKRVFNSLPKIQPATYNGRPIYVKFTMTIDIPLKSRIILKTKTLAQAEFKPNPNKKLLELDSLVYKKYENPEFKSNLNIPFSHSYYSQFDQSLNQLGSNNHTASKPYLYTEVSKYYNLNSVNENSKKRVTSWWGRKLWNENIVAVESEDYWFTLNPILDLQFGKAIKSEASYTYINTRGINFRGGIGTKINFSTSVFESQARFADYFNRYAEVIKPAGGNPAIIPGMGIAKNFKINAYEFPLAEANLTFVPSKHIDLQLGYGRNFIGDGYRSLLESDGASPYPFFKINTKFWKIKYTNTYMWLKDVRPEVTLERTYATKFMANHYLSWNVSNRLNLGFFESVVWSNTNNRGFDVSFVNPIVFYRSVEFASSSRSGNAILGLTYKYKWTNYLNFYGQFLLDDFSLGDFKSGENNWKNKYGYQFGAKYFNAFKIDNLLMQLEYNYVRPYVYSHSMPITNYGHNNQSMGHQWDANFKEFIIISRYHKDRYFADAKITLGTRGLDFDTLENQFNYGGNIFKDYDENRAFDRGVKVGQGNKTSILIAELQGGYVINPLNNLKLYGSFIYRSFNPLENTTLLFKESTNWFTLGLRSDIFNWYFDY